MILGLTGLMIGRFPTITLTAGASGAYKGYAQSGYLNGPYGSISAQPITGLTVATIIGEDADLNGTYFVTVWFVGDQVAALSSYNRIVIDGVSYAQTAPWALGTGVTQGGFGNLAPGVFDSGNTHTIRFAGA